MTPSGPPVTEDISVGRTTSPEDPSRGVVVVQIDQKGPVFDLPVTVTLHYASGQSEDVLVRLSQASTAVRFPLRGPLRGVELNRDSAALVEIVR
jgi:hypothetical protein